MLWLLYGVALALPPALLGASGPTWVGTLPPHEGQALVAVVDPSTGGLVVEATELGGGIRRWSEEAWTLDGSPLDAESPASGHRMDGTKLVSAVAAYGASHQFQYDVDGRLSKVLWANGAQMRVRYDETGRVREINGPGVRAVSLKWANGLSWSDALGRSTKLSTSLAGSEKKVSLTDPLGRTVSSHYRKRDGEWGLTGWTDPRGLETRIGRHGGRMDVTAPGGRVYRLEVDGDGTVASLTMPAGHRWRWERGSDGSLSRMFDPAGRVTRLERDDTGAVVMVSPSGRSKRLVRDGASRVVAIHSATGAVTQLVRGEDGRIRSIIDALGNTIFIDRYPNGWPSAVLGRNGGRWSMGTDTLGKIDRVEGPMGRVIQLHRNGAGWLERIEDSVYGTVALVHDTEGRLVRVTDTVGNQTRFGRDASGWLNSIERPDGAVLQIERNPVGEVVCLRYGAAVWDIERTPDGWPRSMGEHHWERDINGAVRKMSGPLGSLSFTRDPAGWIRSAAAEGWQLDISRDANGWPVKWTGTDGHIEVSRDGEGRLVTERGDHDTRVLRDPRGAPVRIVSAKLGEWRVQRDAAGRVLTTKGPEGVALSVERDLLGRPKWFRFPDGSLMRWETEGSVTVEVRVSAAGVIGAPAQVTWDADGRVHSRRDGGGSWAYRYGPAGELQSIEGDAGQLWSFEADQILDPDGRLQLYNVAGWLIEAQLAPGVPAWGLSGSLLSMMRDDAGRLTGLGTVQGVSRVRFDALGRMVAFHQPDGAERRVRYDVRGRPAGFVDAGEAERALVWSPDSDPTAGVVGLLASGVEAATPWVFLAEGMAARRNGLEVEALVGDGRGDPTWLLDGVGGAGSLAHAEAGMPAQLGTGIVGAAGRLQWFEGGPVQVGSIVVDPVSGQRVDGVMDWPWMVRGPRQLSVLHPSDPAPWEPVSDWADPLEILRSMGVIKPIVEADWMSITSSPRAHFSIPESIDKADPPMGPNREALPLGLEDPLTMALIRSVLPGGTVMGPLGPAAAMVGVEIELPWLPPEWEIPGLESWRQAGAWSAD